MKPKDKIKEIKRRKPHLKDMPGTMAIRFGKLGYKIRRSAWIQGCYWQITQYSAEPLSDNNAEQFFEIEFVGTELFRNDCKAYPEAVAVQYLYNDWEAFK